MTIPRTKSLAERELQRRYRWLASFSRPLAAELTVAACYATVFLLAIFYPDAITNSPFHASGDIAAARNWASLLAIVSVSVLFHQMRTARARTVQSAGIVPMAEIKDVHRSQQLAAAGIACMSIACTAAPAILTFADVRIVFLMTCWPLLASWSYSRCLLLRELPARIHRISLVSSLALCAISPTLHITASAWRQSSEHMWMDTVYEIVCMAMEGLGVLALAGVAIRIKCTRWCSSHGHQPSRGVPRKEWMAKQTAFLGVACLMTVVVIISVVTSGRAAHWPSAGSWNLALHICSMAQVIGYSVLLHVQPDVSAQVLPLEGQVIASQQSAGQHADVLRWLSHETRVPCQILLLSFENIASNLRLFHKFLGTAASQHSSRLARSASYSEIVGPGASPAARIPTGPPVQPPAHLVRLWHEMDQDMSAAQNNLKQLDRVLNAILEYAWLQDVDKGGSAKLGTAESVSILSLVNDTCVGVFPAYRAADAGLEVELSWLGVSSRSRFMPSTPVNEAAAAAAAAAPANQDPSNTPSASALQGGSLQEGSAGAPHRGDPSNSAKLSPAPMSHKARGSQMQYTRPSLEIPAVHVLVDRVRLVQSLLNCLSNSLKYRQHAEGSEALDSKGGSNRTQSSCEVSVKSYAGDELVASKHSGRTAQRDPALRLHVRVKAHLAPRDTMPEAPVTADVPWVLRVSVQDNGQGMTESELESLVQVFTHLRNDERQQGSGLGIAITAKWLHHLGGCITAHSDGRGTGCTITMWIPLDAASPLYGPAQGPADHVSGITHTSSTAHLSGFYAMEPPTRRALSRSSLPNSRLGRGGSRCISWCNSRGCSRGCSIALSRGLSCGSAESVSEADVSPRPALVLRQGSARSVLVEPPRTATAASISAVGGFVTQAPATTHSSSPSSSDGEDIPAQAYTQADLDALPAASVGGKPSPQLKAAIADSSGGFQETMPTGLPLSMSALPPVPPSSQNPALSIYSTPRMADNHHRGSIALELSVPSTPAPLRVLVVDDSAGTRRLLSAAISKASIAVQVSTAADGQAGYDAAMAASARGEPFAIIFSDAHMPVMNGYDSVSQMRRDGVSCRIVGVTGNGTEVDVQRFFDAGVDEVLLKPVSRQQLHRQLHLIARGPGSTRSLGADSSSLGLGSPLA